MKDSTVQVRFKGPTDWNVDQLTGSGAHFRFIGDVQPVRYDYAQELVKQAPDQFEIISKIPYSSLTTEELRAVYKERFGQTGEEIENPDWLIWALVCEDNSAEFGSSDQADETAPEAEANPVPEAEAKDKPKPRKHGKAKPPEELPEVGKTAQVDIEDV